MTVKQAILSFPGLSDITDNFIDKLILDRSLTGATEYSASLKASVELCAADCYMYMLNAPDFSEGGLSIALSRANMKRTAVKLYLENGEYENASKAGDEVSAKSRTNHW